MTGFCLLSALAAMTLGLFVWTRAPRHAANLAFAWGMLWLAAADIAAFMLTRVAPAERNGWLAAATLCLALVAWFSASARCAFSMNSRNFPSISPLDAAGDHYLLSAHMLQHVLIGDASPLLLVLAVRGPLVFFLLPPAVLKPLAALGPLRAALRTVLRPSVTFALWLVVIFSFPQY